MPTDDLDTARDLRGRYRESEANTARLRLLHQAAASFAAPDSRLAEVLGYALDFAAVEAGAILLEDQGALRVVAARGDVLPASTRFPAQGVLAAVLAADAGPLVRIDAVSRLLLPSGGVAGLELLLPLRANGQTAGLLVLVSQARLPVPDEADMQALATLCTMLALSLRAGGSHVRAEPSDQGKQMLAGLTARERQVLALLPHGLTNADIGVRLNIATGTVKVHVERIIFKLGLSDRTQAGAFAVELGFVSSGAIQP